MPSATSAYVWPKTPAAILAHASTRLDAAPACAARIARRTLAASLWGSCCPLLTFGNLRDQKGRSSSSRGGASSKGGGSRGGGASGGGGPAMFERLPPRGMGAGYGLAP